MYRGVGEKIKICEGGSAKFSIPPPIRISNGIALKDDFHLSIIINFHVSNTVLKIHSLVTGFSDLQCTILVIST